MLVHTRREGERIRITVGGERITIHLCSIRGDRARIGIVAGSGVLIDREEVAQRKEVESGESKGQQT